MKIMELRLGTIEIILWTLHESYTKGDRRKFCVNDGI